MSKFEYTYIKYCFNAERMKNLSLNYIKPNHSQESISVLLVGNNPIEMSRVYESLTTLKEKIFKIDTSFSDDDTMKKIASSNPNCIIIDDNLGIASLKHLIEKINLLGKEALSITLLKTKNSQEVLYGVQEYLMKESLTPDRIYFSLVNALRFRKTQKYLKIKYYAGKKRLKRMFI
ncbi:hypothetical protein GCM10011506_32270 [Marivirga lumbricoides]|uniref:Response regulatory domain-containing protein n=2 Tax=Marivirga lumbricoides TaxID=1046115 RepID=A0ABQ1MP25_9BACT|nr:hypothetical protein GCM10011506_32270 [Marivirga lumbricoides]